MQLPFFQTAIQELSLLQTKWKSILDPLLAKPSLQSFILPNIALSSGVNIINHRLGRKLVGWRVVGIDGAATLYDEQASNQTPQLTLVIHSSASVNCNLEVF